MYKLKTLDNFDLKDFEGDVFQIDNKTNPDGIIVRSSKVPDELINDKTLFIARSGVGVNTINIKKATENGTVVFNTPGANSNAVKELALQCLFRSVRPLDNAFQATKELTSTNLLPAAESIRKDFVGSELYGKSVGVLGLGTIGQRFAEACYHLGMQVFGYARSFKDLKYVQQLEKIEEILEVADFVVIFLPSTAETFHLLNEKALEKMKPNAVVMNFGRDEIVDNQAILKALNENKISKYVTDFPNKNLQNNSKVIMLPHLGGNTNEALEHSANLTLQSMLRFLETGNIRRSVNFPSLELPFNSAQRISLYFKSNIEIFNFLSGFLFSGKIPIQEMAVNTRGDYGYQLINTDLTKLSETEVENMIVKLQTVPGMVRVRLIDNPSPMAEKHFEK